MVKDDDWSHPHNQKMMTPSWPGSHLEFFLKIQHVYGQKMIDPPSMTNQDLHLEFFLKIQHVYGVYGHQEFHVKMIDWPPSMTNQDLQHVYGQKMNFST